MADSDNMDSWDRFFNLTRMLHQAGQDVTENCSRMCNIMMTRDERLRQMIKELFSAEDYFSVKDRMIGTGMIADSKVGYNPELSYGSHFFQDLVESGILYNAIFENEKTLVYNVEMLDSFENILNEKDLGCDGVKEIISVYDVSGDDLRLYHDMKSERTLCARIKIPE